MEDCLKIFLFTYHIHVIATVNVAVTIYITYTRKSR